MRSYEFCFLIHGTSTKPMEPKTVPRDFSYADMLSNAGQMEGSESQRDQKATGSP